MDVVMRGRLECCGHGERRVTDDWIKKYQKINVVGKVCRGSI